MKNKRLTECPHCGSKSYTAVEAPWKHNRKYICRRQTCNRVFRKLDADRKARGWSEEEIFQGHRNADMAEAIKTMREHRTNSVQSKETMQIVHDLAVSKTTY